MDEKGKVFWERVDFLRNKMSVRELSERAGLDERTIQATRSMNILPSVTKIYPIAQVLNTTVDYLYSGIAPENKFDGDLFQRLASNQEYVDIASRLFEVDDITLEMVKRILGFEPRELEIKTVLQ